MKVTLITARLRMETAGGVTGTETRENDGNKLPLRRYGDQVHLPGTTVAGSLRAHCSHAPALEALFGSPPSEDRDAPAVPSSIQVLGTCYRPAGDPIKYSRTAIDRRRGAADTHKYHVVEQVRPGSEFDIHLRWNDPDPELLQAFLERLACWHPRLGRGVTRGAGRCKLIGWGKADYDLRTPDGLLSWLSRTDIKHYPEPTNQPREYDPDYLIDLELSIVDALLCGGETESEDGHDVKKPHQLKTDDGDRYWIPGSTLKGILRSRAEYICRVVGTTACTEQDCGTCRTCTLFGCSGEESPRRGRIVVEDAEVSDSGTRLRPHVSIDRFTGGARDTALYFEDVLERGQFRLRVQAIGSTDADDKLLLEAVIADLHEGLVGIGARTTAGYGTVRVTSDWQPPELTTLASRLCESAP
ncbi:RAMP superfamily CRISPR-associated protein [Saccharopolyspora shandongensis]|uniref:RAMP superfamily CRISPR-associated protein n=1 Tax=Saccharopolyspora shandongensis TaxID=418495 RepID=UPI003448EC77